MEKDWWLILGVSVDATPDQVRTAYITRAAEAEAPGKFECVNRAFLDYCQQRLNAKKERCPMCRMRDEYEAQLAQYRWRRVEDELPRMETDVLGYSPLGFAVVFLDDEERWRTSSNGGRTLIRPTHWMPLPPAPDEGE